MAPKLFTLKELSDYLKISEEKILELVDSNILVAYKIGGELLRFRKEQIDAIRSEIESRVTDDDRVSEDEVHQKPKDRLKVLVSGGQKINFKDRIADFFYFNDFYIVSALLVFILVMIIVKG